MAEKIKSVKTYPYSGYHIGYHLPWINQSPHAGFVNILRDDDSGRARQLVRINSQRDYSVAYEILNEICSGRESVNSAAASLLFKIATADPRKLGYVPEIAEEELRIFYLLSDRLGPGETTCKVPIAAAVTRSSEIPQLMRMLIYTNGLPNAGFEMGHGNSDAPSETDYPQGLHQLIKSQFGKVLSSLKINAPHFNQNAASGSMTIRPALGIERTLN